jgi:DNA processing protein
VSALSPTHDGSRRADILEEYAIAPATRATEGQTSSGTSRPKEDPLLAALGFDPIGIDALVERTGMSVAELAARLLDLELAGKVARQAGQVFQRVERA